MNCAKCGSAQQVAMFTDGQMLCFECYDRREAYEERAAIMEYDGGLSRNEAERLASEIIADSRK